MKDVHFAVVLPVCSSTVLLLLGVARGSKSLIFEGCAGNGARSPWPVLVDLQRARCQRGARARNASVRLLTLRLYRRMFDLELVYIREWTVPFYCIAAVLIGCSIAVHAADSWNLHGLHIIRASYFLSVILFCSTTFRLFLRIGWMDLLFGPMLDFFPSGGVIFAILRTRGFK